MPSEAQESTAAFLKAHHLEAGPVTRLLDLLSELGEVAKAHLNATDYGARPFVPGEQWAGELGDTYFSLLCLAHASGVDLDAALHVVLAKYRRRLEQQGHTGSGR
ncbi:putative pyrophosphatase [Deinococcus peraridilitoris DSM 19664]|uniref:Putative pyrophosphatase n=2 Tax=Deinococcus TaxID=1298 RepID=L0A1D9_DEIPD|nr:MazG nucleotide pyrophosphohydrolase domain-containing protein [Deinococcus peraridilitoris]AFZ67269.1 putative pyrophosphatase [Deinococcus peraridilitoris DSM 19664]